MKKLLRSLTEKSWEPRKFDQEVDAYEVGAINVPPQKIALGLFLGVATVLFTLFISAYFIRMALDDWRPMPEPPLLWFNTALLFASSVILQWTRNKLKGEDIEKVKSGLVGGAVLTVGFVMGQLVVWQNMVNAGYYLTSNPANSFFYVLTGIHGLHILGGLWVWTRASVRVWSGTSLEKVRLAVELCTVYWHFLLLVWLVLFALISNT